jgi:hypothetical protein
VQRADGQDLVDHESILAHAAGFHHTPDTNSLTLVAPLNSRRDGACPVSVCAETDLALREDAAA